MIQTRTLAADLSDGIIIGLDEAIPTNHGRLNDTTVVVDDYIRMYEQKHRRDSITVLEGFAASSRYVGARVTEIYAETEDYYYDWFKAFCISGSRFDIQGLRNLDLVNPTACDSNTIRTMGCGYEFTVAPMQILAFYNIIAGDGRLLKPLLVKKMEGDIYDTRRAHPVVMDRQVLRKDVIDSVRVALVICLDV